jgi:glucose-6-phosphate 1-dehydrogenase
MWDGVRELGELAVRRDEWSAFAKSLSYVQGDLAIPEDCAKLGEALAAMESGAASANRLFYLSIAPQLYGPAIEQIGAAGLAKQNGGWRRVVVEKPFGRDLKSAQALNHTLQRHFDETQVFRIDHYLGKETVQNLLVFRFANTIFEPVWNRNYVDNVQITVAEQVDVGDRAGYYDGSGVVRDMVQNHLIQLLTMVAMEPPSASSEESLRTQKVEVLKAIRRWSPEEAVRHAVRGQYRGYLEGNGVASGSTTATYAAMRLCVDNWRWHGVPFYLRTGKAMAEKISEVIVQFKPPPLVTFSLGPGAELASNVLALRLQPDEGIHLRFEAKVPDEEAKLQPVDMEFHYDSAFTEQAIPEAYERLLQDALEGNARLFIRNDHNEEAWRIVDPLLEAWEASNDSPLHVYERNSWGPAAADAFLAEDGRQWLRGGTH